MIDADKELKLLFDAKVHLGHKTNRIHPKAKKNIYTIDNGVSIIDLTKTLEYLNKAKAYIKQLVKDNKTLLIVATKKIVASSIQKVCQENNISHITTKWPAGLLTNFETIKKNVNKLKQMKIDKEEGKWQKLVKHEQSALNKELIKLEKFYGGIINMTKIPDALLIVDIKKEKNSLNEAKKYKIPVIAIADTNVDPDQVTYPIPGNDDSLSSVECLFNELIQPYLKEKK